MIPCLHPAARITGLWPPPGKLGFDVVFNACPLAGFRFERLTTLAQGLTPWPKVSMVHEELPSLKLPNFYSLLWDFDMATNDTLAERLRRRPAKPMGSPRVGSNPTGVVLFVLHDATPVGG